MAIRADRTRILSLVLRQAIGLGVTGISGGLFVALLSARLLGSLLFQTAPADLASLLICVGALIAVTLMAVSFPGDSRGFGRSSGSPSI